MVKYDTFQIKEPPPPPPPPPPPLKTRGDHSKLQQRKYGSYRIVKKINNNTYVINLPNWIEISKTFNVVDLTLFKPYMSLGYQEITQERVLWKWR